MKYDNLAISMWNLPLTQHEYVFIITLLRYRCATFTNAAPAVCKSGHYQAHYNDFRTEISHNPDWSQVTNSTEFSKNMTVFKGKIRMAVKCDQMQRRKHETKKCMGNLLVLQTSKLHTYAEAKTELTEPSELTAPTQKQFGLPVTLATGFAQGVTEFQPPLPLIGLFAPLLFGAP